MANRWRAQFTRPQFSHGGVSGGGQHPVVLHLSMELTDAGIHTGRDIEVCIRPEELDDVERLIQMARAKLREEEK